MPKQKQTPHERVHHAATDAMRAELPPGWKHEHIANALSGEINRARYEAELRADRLAEKAGGEPVRLVCPDCGSRELGTSETIPATARAEFWRTAAGRVDVAHEGETDVAWDCGETVGVTCRGCGWEGAEPDLETEHERARRRASDKIGRAMLHAIETASSEPLDPEELEAAADDLAKDAGAAWAAAARELFA